MRSLVVTERTIQIDQQIITYTLRRNRRAKRLSLRVDQRGLTATVPWSFPQDQLEFFIRERSGWVLSTLDQFARAPSPTKEPTWSPTNGVALLGRRRAVRFGARDQAVALSSETITLPGRLADDDLQARAYLENWLREFARQYLGGRVTTYAGIMGVAPKRMTLRNQKTRWGSCSSQGGISLNWRLIMAPPAIIDYVIIHELAHLIEMNHSDRFWQIVARYDPSHRDHRLWLRQHGTKLTIDQKPAE